MEEVVSKTSPIEEQRKVVVFHEENILNWLRSKLGAGLRLQPNTTVQLTC